MKIPITGADPDRLTPFYGNWSSQSDVTTWMSVGKAESLKLD